MATRNAQPKDSTKPRYGDYPELFWDLRAEEPIDVEHPAVLGRILASGSLEMIRALVPFENIARNVDQVEAPEHVRRFWRLVVKRRQERLDTVRSDAAGVELNRRSSLPGD